MVIFNPNRETIVQTDASLEGIGAILKQRQDDGNFRLVAYFSKKLTEPQKRKKATFLECLAIREALTYWTHRLRGIKFVVLSDHKPLENLKINTRVNEEIRELMLDLSQFDFQCKYVPGSENAEADCLSRNPVLSAEEPSTDLKVINLIEMKEILNDQRQHLSSISEKLKVINKDNVIFTNYKDTKKIVISDVVSKEIIKKVRFKRGHVGPKQMELTLFPFFYNVNF